MRPAFRRGILDTLPLALTCVPFAILCGINGTLAGFSQHRSILLSASVFAGGAQLAAIGLTEHQASFLSVLSAVAALNARHLLYSADTAQAVAFLGRTRRAALGFVLTDETYCLASRYFSVLSSLDVAGYVLGSGLLMYLNWVFFTILGTLTPIGILDSIRTHASIAVPLTFAAAYSSTRRSLRDNAAFLLGGVLTVLLMTLAIPMPFLVGVAVATLTLGFVWPPAGTATQKPPEMVSP